MSVDRWHLPEVRLGVAADADLAARREGLRMLDGIQITDPAAIVSERRIGGLSCIVAEAPSAGTTMLYIHGGGFRLGEPRTWAGFASRLAIAAGIRIVVPDYPLAPEHPFPAALHDLGVVFRALAADSPAGLLLGGDSAGGGLAVSLGLMAQDAGMPAAAILLLSPWLDLTANAASFTECAVSDLNFSKEAAQQAAIQYLAGMDAREPMASPLARASFLGFPPLWVSVSDSEVLRDDALTLARRVGADGGVVDLAVYSGLPHVWPLVMPAAAETETTIGSMARFIERVDCSAVE